LDEEAMALEQPARILVVDDHEGIRRLLERVLAGEGYEVVGLESGLAGLEAALIAERPYDLLITNNHMPGMSGSELVAHVRAAYPGLPILHLDDQSQGAVRLPPDIPNLAKPLNIEDLLDNVRQLLMRDKVPHT
jgi:CheY-like chemotaxis protein